MDTNAKRQALKAHYGPGSAFTKSLDKMPDNQVIAIYLRLKAKGVIK